MKTVHKKTFYFPSYMVLFFLLCLFLHTRCGNHNIKFDSQEWKNWQESETKFSTRWDMLKDLQKHYNLTQLYSNEIVEILGYPERLDSLKGKDYCYRYQYYCGAARAGIDCGYFNLYFDEMDRCVRTEKYHD